MSAVVTQVEYPTPLRTVSSRLFFGCGTASIILYVLLAAVFWTDAVFNRTRTIEIFQYVVLAVLTVLYFVGLFRVHQVSPRSIIAFGLAFAMLGFMITPFDSTDVFFYMAQGWLQTHYGGNPYANVLRDIPNVASDPMIQSRWMELNHNPWLDEPIPYGFAFALLARFVAWLGQGDLWATLMLFAIINLGVHCAVGFLLWNSASMIPGANPKLILYLYAWNPLVLLQYLANLHNDIIMGALILLAFYCLCRRRPMWVLATLAIAGFVKYAAFALVPLAVIRVFRQFGAKEAIKSIAVAAVVTAALSHPYVWDVRSFKYHEVVSQLSESRGSMHGFMMYPLTAVFSTLSPIVHVDLGLVSRICRRLLWLIVIVFGVRELRRAWRRSVASPIEVAVRWTSVLFAVLFVGSSQFYSWYIGMIFPLSLLCVGVSRVSDILVLLSGTHMIGFSFLRFNHFAYFLIATIIPAALVLRWRERLRKEP